jgi:hypothetical protein
MKYIFKNASNCRQTSSQKERKPLFKRVIWSVFKLVFLAVRLVCKFLDLIGGASSDD